MRYLNLFLFCSATAVYGQAQTFHFIKRPSFQIGALFQKWTANSDQDLEEIVVPLVMHYAVNERFSVSFLNTPGRAEIRRADTTSSLAAFTDTKISTALVLGEERALLNFGVSIPSGAKALAADEILVAQEITSHALVMPLSYFGGGWGASASFTGALEWGKWILGGSVGGVYRGSYVPVSGAAKYHPGPEISIAAGFDRPIDERLRLFGDVSYTWYGKDRYNGADVLQADKKISFSLAGNWNVEEWQVVLFLQNHLPRKSPFALDSTFAVNYGNEFEISTEIARQLNPNASLLAVANVRLNSENLYGIDAANIFSVGPGWRGMLTPQLQLQATARLATGTLNDSQILGVEANVGFNFQF